MNPLVKSACILVVAGLAWVSAPGEAEAKLKVLGKGKQQTLDPTQFQSPYNETYKLFSVRCTKCHAMARPIAALTTGITPVSGGSFETKGIKKYVVKMMRKPNSGITKADARRILKFLIQARTMASK